LEKVEIMVKNTNFDQNMIKKKILPKY